MGSHRSEPARIAVVDDDAAVCQSISSLVRSVGYRCRAYQSAEAFLESGGLDETDCILLDIRMPGMDGLTLHLALIRMNYRIPVIY
ncbi:MAG TPA: response regulator, partial [Bryobacteraceae bacterium]|nr:response regulator [Bryobacteraceae bacterium]